MTGLTLSLDELCIKRLELLKELAPASSKVAVLWSAQNPLWEGLIDQMNRSAPALGMHIESLKIISDSQIKPALATLAGRHKYALYVFEDPVLRGKSAEIIAFAAKHRLPAIYGGAKQVRKGGLISYAPSFEDLFRRAAGYVVRILQGANPGELPLQQPTKYELVVNVKAAKAIGLTIPESILQRADEVIR